MKNVITYVGIDAHKKDLFIAMLMGTEQDAGDVDSWRTSRGRCSGWCGSSSARRRGPIRVFYEAGPCGYALQRQLTTARVSCRCGRAGADPAEARRADQDESARCAEAGGAAAARAC